MINRSRGHVFSMNALRETVVNQNVHVGWRGSADYVPTHRKQVGC